MHAGLGGESGHGLTAWFATPPGRYLLHWERERFEAAVANLFGYHALQLGLPELDALQGNRIPHRWLALPEDMATGAAVAPARGVALVTHAAALPFAANSLDLLVLPHTLEFSADPHTVLREVERVLVPEGRVVISGFNPASLWGLRHWRTRWAGRLGCSGELARPFLPESGDFIGPWRVRDWLRLLSFELESEAMGCWRPAVRSEKWLQRCAWMDRAGARWWPMLGGVYFLVAVKRVRGMHLLGPAWKPRRAVAQPVAMAQKQPMSRNE
ncbi:MAG: hypothetical protein RJA36_2831 [Pseudomonadota bacterium]|jgi:SAM-dependent methyltransferase